MPVSSLFFLSFPVSVSWGFLAGGFWLCRKVMALIDGMCHKIALKIHKLLEPLARTHHCRLKDSGLSQMSPCQWIHRRNPTHVPCQHCLHLLKKENKVSANVQVSKWWRCKLKRGRKRYLHCQLHWLLSHVLTVVSAVWWHNETWEI